MNIHRLWLLLCPWFLGVVALLSGGVSVGEEYDMEGSYPHTEPEELDIGNLEAELGSGKMLCTTERGKLLPVLVFTICTL